MATLIKHPAHAIFNSFLNGDLKNPFSSESCAPSSKNHLSAEIVDEGKQISLAFDLPGIGKNNVDIQVENRTLTVTAERKSPEYKETDKIHLSERKYGKFERSFKIGDDLDSENISANFHNGVLLLTLPKLEKAQARKVDIL
jgi:HSP20 family protein